MTIVLRVHKIFNEPVGDWDSVGDSDNDGVATEDEEDESGVDHLNVDAFSNGKIAARRSK